MTQKSNKYRLFPYISKTIQFEESPRGTITKNVYELLLTQLAITAAEKLLNHIDNEITTNTTPTT